LPDGNKKFVIQYKNEANYQVVGVTMTKVTPATPNKTPFHSMRNGKYQIAATYYASVYKEKYN